MNAPETLKYIASAVVGPSAFNGGTAMILLGLFIHYFIAFSFAVFYFAIYPRVSFLRRQPIVSGLLYGIFVWAVMNLLLVPLTKIPHHPLVWQKALLNMGILVVMIGFPGAFIAKNYYKRYSADLPNTG